MLWAKKLEEIGASLARDLTPFLKTRVREADPKALAEDLVKTAVKADMSRSATRLRRRLYAQWGRWDLVDGEFFRLGQEGLEERPMEKDPDEVGDLHVDPFRVFSVVRMIGMGKTRLGLKDRVACAHLILKSIIARTRSPGPPLTERAVAVLMALHAVEGNREVGKGQAVQAIRRHFQQWELPAISDADIESDLQILQNQGAIRDTEDPAKWRLCDRISFPW